MFVVDIELYDVVELVQIFYLLQVWDFVQCFLGVQFELGFELGVEGQCWEVQCWVGQGFGGMQGFYVCSGGLGVFEVFG